MKMFNGYERLSRNYSLLTDNYEHKMGQGYLLDGKKDEMAAFDVFLDVYQMREDMPLWLV